MSDVRTRKNWKVKHCLVRIKGQVCPRNLGNVNEYGNDRVLASALASFVFFYKWGRQQIKSLFVSQIWRKFGIFLDNLLNWDRDPDCLCLFVRVVLVISHFIVSWPISRFWQNKPHLLEQILFHSVKYCFLFINRFSCLNWFNHYKRA